MNFDCIISHKEMSLAVKNKRCICFQYGKEKFQIATKDVGYVVMQAPGILTSGSIIFYDKSGETLSYTTDCGMPMWVFIKVSRREKDSFCLMNNILKEMGLDVRSI